MNKEMIAAIVGSHSELKGKLFARGFLFTDADIDETAYPFYGVWKKDVYGEYTLLIAPEQNGFSYRVGDTTIILVGHAYNPFSMEKDEREILKILVNRINDNMDSFYQTYNELTGVFTCIILGPDNNITLIGDPACMQTTFYCTAEGKLFVSSHTNCIGDILHLKWDDYVEKLARYRFFPLLGNSLPGDITQFAEVRRLVPNHIVCFDRKKNATIQRFYWPQKKKIEYGKIVDEVAEILHNNLQLIAEKWEKPAISLTGGCDSKTTLSCANGLYDKFTYYSYISSEAEHVDAEAAHVICNEIGVEHVIDKISEKNEDFPFFNQTRSLIFWNTGGIIPKHENDTRKQCFYAENDRFDVEVKSWVSEIGRAYYSKRFHHRTDFGTCPTPRKCTTLYKFFFHNRSLVKETDRRFSEYLKVYWDQADDRPIEWQDQFFWEFRVSSWNALCITGEHKFSGDITIPYNNRNILELLLSAPIKDRIEDRLYQDIRQKMDPRIDETGVFITNIKHTKNREKLENIYYMIHSKIPL